MKNLFDEYRERYEYLDIYDKKNVSLNESKYDWWLITKVTILFIGAFIGITYIIWPLFDWIKCMLFFGIVRTF